MSAPNPRAIGAVVFLLALAAVGAFIWSRAAGVSRSSRDFPEGIAMICADAACGEAFTSTLREVARLRQSDDDAPVPCPECGGPSVRARVCPECDGSFPAARLRGGADPPACPLCGEALTLPLGSD